MKKAVLVLVALLFMGAKCSEQDIYVDYGDSNNEYNESCEYLEEELDDMAKKITDLTNFVAADGPNPDGRLKDQVYSGPAVTEVGSKVTADYPMDLLTVFQKLVRDAGANLSGAADTQDDSQFYDALEDFVDWMIDNSEISLTQLVDGTTSINNGLFSIRLAADAQGLIISDLTTGISSAIWPSLLQNNNGLGAGYSLTSALKGGGTNYAGTTPGTAVTTRRNSFVNPFASVTYSSGVLTIDDQVVLTGVPVGAAVHNVGIYYERTAVPNRRVYIPMTCEFSYGSTWLTVEKMVGLTAAGGVPVAAGDVVMYIDYDPSAVD